MVASSPTSSYQRPKKSPVWAFISPIEGEKSFVSCNLCEAEGVKKHLAYTHGSTKNLQDHLSSVHSDNALIASLFPKRRHPTSTKRRATAALASNQLKTEETEEQDDTLKRLKLSLGLSLDENPLLNFLSDERFKTHSRSFIVGPPLEEEAEEEDDVHFYDFKPSTSFLEEEEEMSASEEKPLAQGKTKAIFATDNAEHVLVRSLDALTAFNAKRKNEITGKGAIATKTTCNVFRYLNAVGLRTHFVKEVGEGEFIAEKCEMIPIEWVARRVATGSFLKRNPDVTEGYIFTPPKIETFFKDDANDDPQWSEEQILAKQFKFNGRLIEKHDVCWMRRQTSVVFRLLERAWQREGCVLVDLKIEFGFNIKGEIVLADVIDNDSWRVWPSGDRRLQLDKQFYRDLKEVTDEALKEVKKNYEKVADLTGHFVKSPRSTRVVIVMGSPADKEFAGKIQKEAEKFGVGHVEQRICSAHKSTEEVLDLVAEYEDDATPTVFVAIAGRSNGLGPVISSNTTLPVINAPPCNADWAAQDLWSSLRMPSGVGCSTVLGPEEAGLAAAKVLSHADHLIFGKILAAQSNNVFKILEADKSLQSK